MIHLSSTGRNHETPFFGIYLAGRPRGGGLLALPEPWLCFLEEFSSGSKLANSTQGSRSRVVHEASLLGAERSFVMPVTAQLHLPGPSPRVAARTFPLSLGLLSLWGCGLFHLSQLPGWRPSPRP